MKTVCLLLVALSALVGCSDGTPVTITNRSAVPLDNVVIFGAGFRETVGHIAPAQSVSVRVKPKGETGLGISFRAGARLVEARPQGYFEGGGLYKVGVIITPDLGMRVSGELKY